MSKYITDEDFKNKDYTEQAIEKADYEDCVFSNCIFSGADLSETGFEDCVFESCDFSNTKITNTAFKNIRFRNCKLIGLQFDECNPFLLEFYFENCILNYSSFYQLKIKATKYKKCTLHEVDFSETDLSEASFDSCDLMGTMFSYTKLEKADFRGSLNITLNPEQNLITGAKFSLESLPGLLSKYNITVG